MPVLAGRVLGTGTIDIIGVLLVLAILMWIPIHILTFAMRYLKIIRWGRCLLFPLFMGRERQALVGATILTGVTMMLAIVLNAVRGPYLLASILAVVVLIGFTIYYTDDPSPERNFTLFKVASLYMLVSMLIIGLAG